MKRRPLPPPTGGNSLLVIFAVTCLTVFAVLTLSTVTASRRLSDAAAQSVTDYYAADTAAEEVLSRLRAGETPSGVREEDGVYSYTVSISDTRELRVEVRASDFTVLRWQEVSTAAAE